MLRINKNDKEHYKMSLVVYVHTECEKKVLVHASANAGQSLIKLLVALASIHGYRLRTKDVTQAYLQTTENPSRIYLHLESLD